MHSAIVIADSGIVTGDSEKTPKIGHDESEWPVTFLRNRRSRSNGMCGHVGAEYAISSLYYLSYLIKIYSSRKLKTD